MIKRRSFLQALIGAPLLTLLRPRAVQAQAPSYIGLVFSDDAGNTDFTSLSDGNLATGVQYNP